MKELIVSVAGRYGLPPALVESIVQAHDDIFRRLSVCESLTARLDERGILRKE